MPELELGIKFGKLYLGLFRDSYQKLQAMLRVCS